MAHRKFLEWIISRLDRPSFSSPSLIFNTSGRNIRSFFPKGTDLREIFTEQIKIVEHYLNFSSICKFDYLNSIQQTLKYHCVALIT